ncbi:hypothetical protein E2P64_00760 [Candidatus Bathyarchaeota archaeon]|nr:hypothetical protein E2P64_00760 [Candidatus Bathyarchaeota archaeon]
MVKHVRYVSVDEKPKTWMGLNLGKPVEKGKLLSFEPHILNEDGGSTTYLMYGRALVTEKNGGNLETIKKVYDFKKPVGEDTLKELGFGFSGTFMGNLKYQNGESFIMAKPEGDNKLRVQTISFDNQLYAP